MKYIGTIGVFLVSAFLIVMNSQPSHSTAPETQHAKAIFAGGCFWCMEPAYDKLDGVIATTSGYTGGHKDNPTYEEVSAGGTGHTEALEVTYDSTKIDYATLLEVYWRNSDPTMADSQFCDHGTQYRPAIFYSTDEERQAIEASKKNIESTKTFPGDIVTEISPATKFYPAEDYHQDYYQKNPVRYKFYRYSCGRDQRLKELWG